LLEPDDRARFEQLVLPHLDAAFNLARWLLRSRSDAEDVAQEALLRAYRFFDGFHGGDPRAWLTAQIKGAVLLAGNPPLAPSDQIITELFAAREERQEMRREAVDPAAGDPKAAFNPVRSAYLPHYRAQVLARAQSAALTDRPFAERLVHFWTNHFAVSADKGAVFGVAGTLENEAIRPHVGGRFLDMLTAVEQHPAMIGFLDNQYSVGKDSTVMVHLARKAFYPAKPPFPLLHIDTGWKFREMIAFRDATARRLELDLLVHTNDEGTARGISPNYHLDPCCLNNRSSVISAIIRDHEDAVPPEVLESPLVEAVPVWAGAGVVDPDAIAHQASIQCDQVGQRPPSSDDVTRRSELEIGRALMAQHGRVDRSERRRLPDSEVMPGSRPIEAMPPCYAYLERQIAFEGDIAFGIVFAPHETGCRRPGIVPFPECEEAPIAAKRIAEPAHGRELARAEQPFGGEAARPPCLFESD